MDIRPQQTDSAFKATARSAAALPHEGIRVDFTVSEICERVLRVYMCMRFGMVRMHDRLHASICTVQYQVGFISQRGIQGTDTTLEAEDGMSTRLQVEFIR